MAVAVHQRTAVLAGAAMDHCRLNHDGPLTGAVPGMMIATPEQCQYHPKTILITCRIPCPFSGDFRSIGRLSRTGPVVLVFRVLDSLPSVTTRHRSGSGTMTRQPTANSMASPPSPAPHEALPIKPLGTHALRPFLPGGGQRLQPICLLRRNIVGLTWI